MRQETLKMSGKKKKKDKKKSSGALSHIGSHLFPSAIFAAAPRTASPLSSTWPRSAQSKSPIAQAVGGAGNIGWAFVGDLNRTHSTGEVQGNPDPVHRPPADLPASASSTPPVEESTYEAVDVGENYDKTTKFARESSSTKGGEGAAGPSSHMYHVLDESAEPKVEPVYAVVDKSKKKSSKVNKEQLDRQDTHDYDEVNVDDNVVLSSDDDLTDVTSNDEDSSSIAPMKRNTKNSQKGKKTDTKPIKVRKHSKDDSTSEEQSASHSDKGDAAFEQRCGETIDAPHRKKSSKRSLHLSKKRNSIDTVDEMTAEHQNDDACTGTTSPTESSYTITGIKRGSKKSSLKRRSQVAPEEELDLSGSDSPDKETRHIERLGFEGTSQKVGLSDISEDEEGYAIKVYPQPKGNDQRSDDMIVNEEVQMTENENIILSAPYPHSLFDESPEQLEQHSKSSLENFETLEQVSPSKSESFFMEQQKQLEHLIRQQESVYRQQAEQQREQQKQAEKLAQQQLELQKQLQQLEHIQQERRHSPPSRLSLQDVRLQKDMVEQQENLLRLQQQQQAKYESQQDRVLKQQENICDQIRELEFHQKELQSNLSSWSPKETDLAEIRWQEKEIIQLLNKQQSHQQRYDKLHKLQQDQLEQQAMKFQQERLTLETQQDALQTKIKEQEEKSKKLENELQSISAKESRPSKTMRRRNATPDSDSEMITSSQADEVDAATPVSRREASLRGSQRSNKKVKSTSRSSLNHIDMLALENSRLSEVNVSVQKENQVLKQLSETLEKGSGGTSLITEQYIKDLQQENKVLQESVHRLNVELSRYQMKYRQTSVEEVDSLIFPKSSSVESYPWLVNTKFLAPLFVAYDDRLKDREDIIKIYDVRVEEMKSFKARLMEIVKENQDLHMRHAKSKPDALDLDEWQQLQEQAKLVVEENSILMKQQDLQQRKIKEMQGTHGQDVSKLSMRITKVKLEKTTLETEFEDYRCRHTALVEKYEVMLGQEDKKMLIDEHLAMMDECRSLMEDMKEKKKCEMKEMESKVEIIPLQERLLLFPTDSKAHISQLVKELDVYRKTHRKLERKTLLLERRLEHILEREVNAQQTLSEVLKIAEKTAEERDSFEEFARTQELKRKKSKSLLYQGDLSILGLQEKLKSNKRKSSEKVALMTG
ncbi:hypothetical protein QZH41_011825 [Actinostola sp. cb2023]|nr:hypothetical protein QZH41_011825 [Actinostola sp. cb2023]